MRHACLLLVALTAFACGGDSTGPSDQPTASGDLEVSLVRAPGSAMLLFSGSVKAGTAPPVTMLDGRTDTIPDLPAGTHALEVGGLIADCTVQGQNPRTVSITENQVTQVEIQVECTFDPEPRLAFVWREEDSGNRPRPWQKHRQQTCGRRVRP